MSEKMKVKKGAASFYIVAFTTLILVIIAASFAAIIVSEITRTSNDDLAQSAYDSALAGVEDAKLAFYAYRDCVKDSSGSGCAEIIATVETSEPDCDMVATILGRDTVDGGVMIQESNTAGNNMQQYYTCVKIEDSLGDYRSTLTSTNPMRVVKVSFDGVEASRIQKMKIRWYADSENADTRNYANFNLDNGVTFGSLSSTVTPTPPVISVGMIQTAETFTLDQFNETVGNATNRGMLYLVPAGSKDNSQDGAIKSTLQSLYNNSDPSGRNYFSAYDGSSNHIGVDGFLKSNNKVVKNLPYAVYCREDSDFACEATIDLPNPVGGIRNNDTFVFVVSLPYGKPSTDFALEFYCGDDAVCWSETGTNEDGEITTETSSRAHLKGVQIKVDSTGRANDLYRRVETRLESGDESSLSTLGALELLGDGDKLLFEKDMTVVCEYNFGGPTC